MTRPSSPDLDAALEALRSGDPRGGELRVLDPLARALAREGPRTRAHARASADLATYLLALGDFERAEGALHAAVTVQPTTGEELREHLGWVTTYAEVLERRERWEDAAAWRRTAIEVSTWVHGPDDERTALLRLALAELLLRDGPGEEAGLVAEDALFAIWARGGGDEATSAELRAARALLVYGLAHGTQGAFGTFLDAAPPATRDHAAALAPALAETHPPLLVLPVVARLQRDRAERLGPTDAGAIELLVVTTRLAERARDGALHVVTLRHLVDVLGRAGRSRDRVDALLALATAGADRGDEELATHALVEARRAAGDDAEAAGVVGLAEGRLHLAAGRTDLAARALTAALRGPHGGRAAMLLGLALAHDDRAAEALPVLQEAARRLPADRAEASIVRHHLDALRAGRPCGCDPVRAALLAEVTARLAAEVPDLPVDEVEVGLEDGTPHVELRVGRAPTERERRGVDRALKGAVDVIRRRTET